MASWTVSTPRRYRVGMERLVNGRPWTIEDPPGEITRFVEWYCWERVRGERYHDYAKRFDLKPSVVKGYMLDERVRDLLDAALRKTNAGPDRVQEVVDMLFYRSVVLEDVQAAKLYLQHVDRLMVRSHLDVVVHDARTLSNEDLHAELQRAVALLEGRAALPEPIEDAVVIEDIQV